MTDADLIYNALLRVESRLETAATHPWGAEVEPELAAKLMILAKMLREEIASGLAEWRR